MRGTGSLAAPTSPMPQRGSARREKREKQRKRKAEGGESAPACEAGGLRRSGGIPRAGSGPAEPGARRCGSWLPSSSLTSRSSWSVESLSATTHYFQWAVSCGGGGRARGQRAAGTVHLCLGIAASLLSSPGPPKGLGGGTTVRWRERSGKGRRKRGRDKGEEEGRDAQE